MVIHLQLPYKYTLFLEAGYTHAEISKMIANSHLINAAWNLILPFISKRLEHRFIICLSICMYTLASLLFAFYTTPFSYLIANTLVSLTFSTLMRSFHDWWLNEEILLPEEYKANITFHEWRSFINLMVSIASSPTSSFVTHKYGIHFLYGLTPGLILAAIPLVIMMLAPSTVSEKKSIRNDFVEIYSFLNKSKIIFLIIFIEIIQGISMFLVNQRLSAFLMTPNHRPFMGFVSGTYAILGLLGTQFLSFLSDILTPEKSWLLAALFSGISLTMIYVFYKNKYIVFIMNCCESFCSSIVMANRVEIVKAFFPRSIRGYLVTMSRTPTLVLSYISLKIIVTNHIEYFALLGGILMITSSIIGIPFLRRKYEGESVPAEPGNEYSNSIQAEEDYKEEEEAFSDSDDEKTA